MFCTRNGNFSTSHFPHTGHVHKTVCSPIVPLILLFPLYLIQVMTLAHAVHSVVEAGGDASSGPVLLAAIKGLGQSSSSSGSRNGGSGGGGATLEGVTGEVTFAGNGDRGGTVEYTVYNHGGRHVGDFRWIGTTGGGDSSSSSSSNTSTAFKRCDTSAPLESLPEACASRITYNTLLNTKPVQNDFETATNMELVTSVSAVSATVVVLVIAVFFVVWRRLRTRIKEIEDIIATLSPEQVKLVEDVLHESSNLELWKVRLRCIDDLDLDLD